MISVWIMMAFLGSHGNPIIIDNIATKSECERMVQHFGGVDLFSTGRQYRCVQVWKVKQ